MATLPQNEAILGVQFKILKTHRDERGFFREVLRFNDPIFDAAKFAQWSHSRMVQNVVKGWHYHHLQTDWWYVPIGEIQTVLYDNREESPTYKTKLAFTMGDSAAYGAEANEVCVKIPPGVLHGCKVLSPEAHLFYITSEVYNPADEGRYPFNSNVVPHDWGAGVLTVENDRRCFTPENPRRRLSR